jgi:NAD(P)-dependent dehydrogenase (short-subunit alcohol dehydrogenase family)
MQIEGKTAIVTGAASGIGRAIAETLAQRHLKGLALVDISAEVHSVALSIQATGPTHVRSFVGDVTSDEFRREIFDKTAAELGVVTICVPAAGITRDALAAKVDKATGKARIYPIEDFRKTAEVNLIAPTYWALEMVARVAEDRFKRAMKRWEPSEDVQGAVIFIGSVSSQGNQGQVSYAGTKSGLEGVARTLMKEAMYHGVRCMVLHPGFTDTPMVRKLGQQYIDTQILPYTHLHRLIRPDEIADAVCFMITNPAVSGEIWADAGWHPCT